MDIHINNIDKISGQKDLRRRDTPSLRLAGIFFSLGVILLIFVGYWVQSREFYSGMLITEIILIAAPVVVLLLLGRYDIKKTLRLNKVSILTLLLVFLIMLFAIPAVSVLNLANLVLLKVIFGKVFVAGIPTPADPAGLAAGILVVGALPGICEEIMFRGGIQKGLERIGTVKGILITAFLFGLMHLDFQKFLGTFLLGALIGYMVYRTNSLFTGIFAHFVNNSASVAVTFALTRLYRFLSDSGVKGFESQLESQSDINVYLESLVSIPLPQLIFTIAVWVFMFIGSAAGVWGLMVALNHIHADRSPVPASGSAPSTGSASADDSVQSEQADKFRFRGLLWFAPGIVVVVLRYIAQGMAMMGVKGELARFLMLITNVR